MNKNSVKNHIQRYKCPSCNKTFTFQKKLNPSNISLDYSQGKQPDKELALKYKCAIKTIQKYIDSASKLVLKPPIFN